MANGARVPIEDIEIATVTATDHHPIWVTNDGQWIQAIDVEPGDYLLDQHGVTVMVDDIDIRTVANQTVHNLTVADLHTFFVLAGDQPILTHNTTCCPDATNSRALVDAGKYDYLFGNLSSNSHNLARSLQNQRQLNGIGVFDNTAGRNLLSAHFDDVVSTNSNVLRTWSDEFGTFQVRESLLAGPNGLLKLESTWQVTSDGLRLTTVIPLGRG